MRRNKVKEAAVTIRNIMVAATAATILSLTIALKVGYVEVGSYTVNKVERIWNTGAHERGFYADDCYYMVYTDGGVFKVELEGINAYAYGAGLVRPGETYQLKTRGARIESLGIYPNIIEVIE